jgi:hypothetical protein
MGFVDNRQIEWRSSTQRRCAAFAAGKFPADQIHARRKEIRLILSCLNSEEVQKLVLPLADERLWHDQQDALCAFRAALRDNQAGLDRLSQSNFVREDATAFTQAPECKDYSVDLVRIGINPCLPLGSCVALSLIWSSDTDEVFSENPLVEGVHKDV